MTGEAQEQIVAQEKTGGLRSEEVTLLGPDEYQSSKHSVDLGNLPRDFNNENRLQARTENIKIQKYLRKKLPPPIKCTTTTFLAALMWRRPLNSDLNRYRSQRAKEDA